VDFILSLLPQGSSLAPWGAPEGSREPLQGSLGGATSPRQAFLDKKTSFYSCGKHTSASPAGNVSAAAVQEGAPAPAPLPLGAGPALLHRLPVVLAAHTREPEAMSISPGPFLRLFQPFTPPLTHPLLPQLDNSPLQRKPTQPTLSCLLPASPHHSKESRVKANARAKSPRHGSGTSSAAARATEPITPE